MVPIEWNPPGPADDVVGSRDRVTARGSDAATYLQSQVSQDVSALAVGDSAWTFVLEPNGRIGALARVVRDGDDSFALDTDAGFGHGLLDRLSRFRIRVEVALELEPHGGDAAPELRPSESERRRIEAGWPRMGYELVPGETLVAGTGLANLAVSFTKGCYPGQELVERMDARGAEAPSRLYSLTVAETAQPGDAVLDTAGESIGTITSAIDGYGIAWIQRRATNPDGGQAQSHPSDNANSDNANSDNANSGGLAT